MAKECICSSIGTKYCSICMYASYCSRECQLKDWPNHKYECKSITETIESIHNGLKPWIGGLVANTIVVRINSTVKVASRIGAFCNVYYKDKDRNYHNEFSLGQPTGKPTIYYVFADHKRAKDHTVEGPQKNISEGHYLYI